MPNLASFSQIRNHRRAELGISLIQRNVFLGTFFSNKKNLASLKEYPGGPKHPLPPEPGGKQRIWGSGGGFWHPVPPGHVWRAGHQSLVMPDKPIKQKSEYFSNLYMKYVYIINIFVFIICISESMNIHF